MSFINKFEIAPLQDKIGRDNFFTGFGEQVNVTRTDHIACQFHYDVSPLEVVINKTNDFASTEIINSQLQISTSDNMASKIEVRTRNYIVYEPGHEIYALFTAEYNPPIAGTYQYIGAFDEYDGFYIGFDDNKNFIIGRRYNTDDIITKQKDFSEDKLDGTGPSEFNINPHFNNLYMITFGWLGIAPIVFWIHTGKKAGWVPFHVIDLTNSINGTTICNPVLPMKVELNNGMTQANIKARISCFAGGIFSSSDNEKSSDLRWFSVDGLKTINSNENTNILTLFNNTTFCSKPNKVAAYLYGLSYTTDDNGNINNSWYNTTTSPIKLTIYRNSAFINEANWSTIDSGNSVITYNTNQSTFNSGELLLTLGVAPNNGSYYDLTRPIKIYPGETISACAWSNNPVTINICFNWYEDF